jgi:cell pole-organizing protein PopZ
MEEILASIRRIISEDDTPEGASAAPSSSSPEEASAAERAAEAPPIVDEPEEEVAAASDFDDSDELELTEKVESHGDLDVYSPSAAPEPAENFDAAAMGALVSAPAAAAASAAFGQLSGKMLMPAAGRTLEDVVRELLRPLLQNWLDENLPGIVQRAVDAEVSRIARGG